MTKYVTHHDFLLLLQDNYIKTIKYFSEADFDSLEIYNISKIPLEVLNNICIIGKLESVKLLLSKKNKTILTIDVTLDGQPLKISKVKLFSQKDAQNLKQILQVNKRFCFMNLKPSIVNESNIYFEITPLSSICRFDLPIFECEKLQKLEKAQKYSDQ